MRRTRIFETAILRDFFELVSTIERVLHIKEGLFDRVIEFVLVIVQKPQIIQHFSGSRQMLNTVSARESIMIIH